MKNFPTRNNAPLFAELQMTVVGLDGLGSSPQAILSRDLPGEAVRLVMEVHGSTSGELAGSFSGTDYATVTPEGIRSNVHGVLLTESGERLALRILGEQRGTELWAELRLRHYGALASVNERRFFAHGPATAGAGAKLEVYELQAEPYFADPDLSAVDYANFPFTLEALQANPDAVSVYSGEGRLDGAESFGAEVMAIFGGQVPFPEEGIRMNGYFSGPAAGGVNGVISGRNFLWVTPDGTTHMNSKILVRTFDGESLLVEAQGASFAATGPLWWETSRTVSNLPRYQELARRFNVGVGSTDVQTGKIVYNHFALPEDPFAGR